LIRASESNADIETYLLCKTFHCLPSDLEKESASDLDLLLGIHNTIEKERMKAEKSANKRSH